MKEMKHLHTKSNLQIYFNRQKEEALKDYENIYLCETYQMMGTVVDELVRLKSQDKKDLRDFLAEDYHFEEFLQDA